MNWDNICHLKNVNEIEKAISEKIRIAYDEQTPIVHNMYSIVYEGDQKKKIHG